MIKESELDEKFQTIFNKLTNDENLQTRLSENIKSLAMPSATKQIVDEIVKLIGTCKF